MVIRIAIVGAQSLKARMEPECYAYGRRSGCDQRDGDRAQFSEGTIPPANFTVTLAPATVGGGPSGSTTANAVTVVSGTTERVSFKVPKSIGVPAATPYQVSIAGTTQAGAAFESSNSAALTVNALVSITTSSLATGTVGIHYSQTLSASGGTGQYTWQVSSGNLPGVLSLNSAAGVISGLPSTAGTLHCVLKVTDSDQSSTSKEFALTIDPALSITTSSPLPTGTVGVNYSQTLRASGGSGQSLSVSAGASPGGLSLNPARARSLDNLPQQARPASQFW